MATSFGIAGLASRVIEPSERQRRSPTCHSSWASARTAPASRSSAGRAFPRFGRWVMLEQHEW